MKLTLAALAATLALAPAAYADVTLRCDSINGGTPAIYAIAGNTARSLGGDRAQPFRYHVEETPTQFKLTETTETAAVTANAGVTDVVVFIDRITGRITIRFKIGTEYITDVGQCSLAQARF